MSSLYVNRSWGRYETLFNRTDCKVKYLRIKPKTGMSFQRHFKRQELWFIQDGELEIKWCLGDNKTPGTSYFIKKLKKFDWWYVISANWHQVINPTDDYTTVIEVQFGEECVDDDIERLFYYD